MPDAAMHWIFGRKVMEEIPWIRSPEVFSFALTGGDDWALYGFPLLRKSRNGRAEEMHTRKTGLFLRTLEAETELRDYWAGFVCHYVLDSLCHPYISAHAGVYDGTEETRMYRGGHTAWERALDRWILREEGIPGRHPVSDMVRSRLPEAFREPLDRVYRKVYGWENAWRDLNRARQGLTFFLWCVEDPHHILRTLTEPMTHPTLRALLYSRDAVGDRDLLNLSHGAWIHPWTGEEHRESFPELMEMSLRTAREMILGREEIGNRSYLTGLEIGDRRNEHPMRQGKSLPEEAAGSQEVRISGNV